MNYCRVFACPNPAIKLYLIDPVTKIWLCQGCIDLAEGSVREDAAKQRELAVAG